MTISTEDQPQSMNQPMGFKIPSSGDCQNSPVWCTSNFGARVGSFVTHLQKGIKPDGFCQNGKLLRLQNLQFWCTSNLVSVCVSDFLGDFHQKNHHSAERGRSFLLMVRSPSVSDPHSPPQKCTKLGLSGQLS